MSKIFYLSLFFSLFFQACTESDKQNNTNEKTAITITLDIGESIRCLNTSTFKVKPINGTPDITILNDIDSKSTTITLETNSVGKILVTDCAVLN